MVDLTALPAGSPAHRADLSLVCLSGLLQMSVNKNRAFKLKLLLAIDSAFFFLELGVGAAVGSLALLADSFHSQSITRLSSRSSLTLAVRNIFWVCRTGSSLDECADVAFACLVLRVV